MYGCMVAVQNPMSMYACMNVLDHACKGAKHLLALESSLLLLLLLLFCFVLHAFATPSIYCGVA